MREGLIALRLFRMSFQIRIQFLSLFGCQLIVDPLLDQIFNAFSLSHVTLLILGEVGLSISVFNLLRARAMRDIKVPFGISSASAASL
jgi:hypothetical protein